VSPEAPGTLAAVGQFGLIAEIRRILAAPDGPAGPAPGGAPPRGHVVLGPGDDCAVVATEPNHELLLTTDAQHEGVHFDLRWMAVRQAGRRAMAAALSDIAAMAGRPRAALVALAFPADTTVEAALDLVRGAAEVGEVHGCPIVGGNVVRSPGGISITTSIVGQVRRGKAVRRSGARPGDEVWVTGEPGAALAGLLALKAGLGADPQAAPFVRRFLEPTPRIAEAELLAEKGQLHALMDVSDGLAGDLARICEESGVGVRLNRERIPVSPALRALAPRLGAGDPVDLVLRGGEDFELLVVAPAGRIPTVKGEIEGVFGVKMWRIGDVRPEAGITIQDPGSMAFPLEVRSFDHFAS